MLLQNVTYTRSWYLAIGLIFDIRKKDAEEPNDSGIEQGLCTANIIHGDHTSGKPWKIQESSFPYWKVRECPLFCLKSWFCPWLSWKFQIILRFDKLQLLQQCFVKICCPRIESNQLICTVNRLISIWGQHTFVIHCCNNWILEKCIITWNFLDKLKTKFLNKIKDTRVNYRFLWSHFNLFVIQTHSLLLFSSREALKLSSILVEKIISDGVYWLLNCLE